MNCLRVLLVGDDGPSVSKAEKTLSDEKYAVSSVDDFDKAAAHLRRIKGKTIILSELTVGGRDGIAFLKETLQQYPFLPFTFVSKSPPLESVIEALKQGAYDFLRKPVPPDILCHSVARSVERLNLSLDTEKYEKDSRDRISRLQAELKEARLQSAYKGYLISIAGHDFKSVLTVLDGYFQILKEKCADCRRPEPIQLKEETVRTITRLRTMANTLLDVEAAEKGELKVAAKEFDLTPVLQQCAAFYRPYAEQKRIGIILEGNLPATRPRGDVERVLQIMDNLLYNAIKFTPPGGEIRIGARAEDRKIVTAWVHDTGIGIPKSQLEAIFSENRIVMKRDGSSRMGLGLNICKKLLEIQNGKIWLESEPGQGTKVFFSLPL